MVRFNESLSKISWFSIRLYPVEVDVIKKRRGQVAGSA